MNTEQHAFEAGNLIRKLGKDFPKDRVVEGIKFAIMLADAHAGTVTPERASALRAWVPASRDIQAFWRGYEGR